MISGSGMSCTPLHKNGMREDGCTSMLHGGQTVKNGPGGEQADAERGGCPGGFREHPVTGKAALFVAPLFMASVDGCRSHEEASALVAGLFQRRVAGAYQHKFGVGDLVAWDNRRMLHSATPMPADLDISVAQRIVHRIRMSSTEVPRPPPPLAP